MKKSKFWFNLFYILTIFYFLLSTFNKINTKPIGSISYSQYIQNVENNNITKIIATNYSSDLTVYTKEPIKTLEYERAKTEYEKYANNDNLTLFEKLKKKWNYYPNEETLKSLEND